MKLLLVTTFFSSDLYKLLLVTIVLGSVFGLLTISVLYLASLIALNRPTEERKAN